MCWQWWSSLVNMLTMAVFLAQYADDGSLLYLTCWRWWSSLLNILTMVVFLAQCADDGSHLFLVFWECRSHCFTILIQTHNMDSFQNYSKVYITHTAALQPSLALNHNYWSHIISIFINSPKLWRMVIHAIILVGNIEDLAQNCSNSIANALKSLQSCAKPSL